MGAAFVCTLSQKLQASKVSDAGQSGKVELLAMMGLFGALISVIQLLVVERQVLSQSAWSWKVLFLNLFLHSFLSLVTQGTITQAMPHCCMAAILAISRAAWHSSCCSLLWQAAPASR